MRLRGFETQLHNAEKHLDDTSSRQSEIETYIVQYLLVRACAEYESRLVRMVERRCLRVGDAHVKRFVQRSIRDSCRYFNIGDIKGLLGRLGDDYKEAFDSKVMNTQSHVAWDNIYTNRHSVAHGHGSVQMNFADLKQNYSESLAVLDALAHCLGLTSDEMRDLV